MKFAIWGCRHGHIEEFIQQMLALGHEFLGICEAEGKLAPALAQKYGVPLLNDENSLFDMGPQVMGSSAINNRKSAVITRCLEESVHVMVDKPLTATLEEYQQVKSRMEKHPEIQVGMMLTERFNPGIYQLNQLIRQGRLGKLIGFTILKPHKLSAPQRDSWHFSKEENGGIVVDLMVHDFDLLRWFTGSEIQEAAGYVKLGDAEGYPEFWDDARVLVRMDSGVTASLQTDWWMPDGYWTYGQGNIICTGTEGHCVVHTTGNRLLGMERSFCVLTTRTEGQTVLECSDPPVNLTEDFLSRINGRTSCITAGDILSATRASLEADRAVKLIPAGG